VGGITIYLVSLFHHLFPFFTFFVPFIQYFDVGVIDSILIRLTIIVFVVIYGEIYLKSFFDSLVRTGQAVSVFSPGIGSSQSFFLR